jgi:hypothetical protein
MLGSARRNLTWCCDFGKLEIADSECYNHIVQQTNITRYTIVWLKKEASFTRYCISAQSHRNTPRTVGAVPEFYVNVRVRHFD